MELIYKHSGLCDSDSSGFMLSGCLSVCPSIIIHYFLCLLIDLFGPNLNIVTNTIKSFEHSKEKQQIFTVVSKNLKDSSSNFSCQSKVVK